MTDNSRPLEPRGNQRDELLDVGMEAAYGAQDSLRNGESVLATLRKIGGASPNILLRDVAEETSRVVAPRSSEIPNDAPQDPRYQIAGEIARGGMGVILKGRDRELGRDVAMKVLRRKNIQDPVMLHRFVEEAQIGGQLQHPGIVPVYDLGLRVNGQPFFTMKLVQGQTLAELLQNRSNSNFDRRRFLSIFERVCQTMAYAHARGVIHRDLKPTNIMVGTFGEVQVMDWGLAKVLARGGVADEHPGRKVLHKKAPVETIRSSNSGSDSYAGSIIGTPAYMPPEQARGEVDKLEKRSDVFSLGAILCEILTGVPPFTGTTQETTRRRAAQGETDRALARLQTCGTDQVLLKIARTCLSVEANRRPADAGVLARTFSSYLSSIDRKLRKAELATAAAEGRVTVERRARRLTVALATSILSALLIGGGAYVWFEQGQRTRAETLNGIIAEANQLHVEARNSDGDLLVWEQALSAARFAQNRAEEDDADLETRKNVDSLVLRIQAEGEAAERDRRMADKLLELRYELLVRDVDDPGYAARNRDYALAFQDYGVDVDHLSPNESIGRIQDSEISDELVYALDDWAWIRFLSETAESTNWKDLVRLARDADLDSERRKYRDAYLNNDIEYLRKLVEPPRLESMQPTTLLLLGRILSYRGESKAAVAVYETGQQLYPGNVNLTLNLAHGLSHQGNNNEALRFYTAAVSLKPHSSTWTGYGSAFAALGRMDDAFQAFEKAMDINADFAPLHCNLGVALGKIGDHQGAMEAHLRVLRIDPNHGAHAHSNLGNALAGQGKLNEAIEWYKKAIDIQPDYAIAHNNLGIARAKKGELDEAIESFQEAIKIQPDYSMAYTNLGRVLVMMGKLDKAIEWHNKAIEIEPDNADAHHNLGVALAKNGKPDEAIQSFQEAIKIQPDHADAYFNLGFRLAEMGKLDEAIEVYETTIKIEPDHANAHNNLGAALVQKGQLDHAIDHFEKAVEIEPDHAIAHANLGSALSEKGRHDEAIESYRMVTKIEPDNANAHDTLGFALRISGRLDEAIESHMRAIAIEPEHANALHNLAIALANRGRFDEAIKSYKRANEIEPNPEVLRGLVDLLTKHGRYDEAMAHAESAFSLPGDWGEAGYLVAKIHAVQGHFDQAFTWLDRALDEGWSRLSGRGAARAPAMRGLRKDPRFIDYLYKVLAFRRETFPQGHAEIGEALVYLGLHLLDSERYAEAEPLARESLQIRERVLETWDNLHFNTMRILGQALTGQGEFFEAEELLTEAWHGLFLTTNHHTSTEQRTATRKALVKLYELWGKPDLAEQWRARFEEDGLFREGTRLNGASEWAKGELIYARLVERVPESPIPWHWLGRTRQHQNKLAEAIGPFKKAAELSEDWRGVAAYRLSQVYAELGEKEHAFEWLQHAAEGGWRDTEDMAITPHFASLRDDPRFAQSVELTEAIANADRAFIQADRSRTAYAVARTYSRHGNLDRAFEWLQHAAEAGFRDTEHMATDADIDSVRDDPRYAKIVALMEGKD